VTRDVVLRLQALEERTESNQCQVHLEQRVNKVEQLTKKLAEKAFKLLSSHNARRDEEVFGRCIQSAHVQAETEKVQGLEKDIAKLAAKVESRIEVLEATWERDANRLAEIEHHCQVAYSDFHEKITSLCIWQQQELQESSTIDAFLLGKERGRLALPAPTSRALVQDSGANHDRDLQNLVEENRRTLDSVDQYRATVDSLQDAVARVFPEVQALRYRVEGSEPCRMGDTIMELRQKIEELGADLQKFEMVQDAAAEICNMQRGTRQARDLGLPAGTSVSKIGGGPNILSEAIASMLQDVEARIERNEARLERRFGDITEKLTPLQDFVEQQRLATYQVSRQVPDLAKKVDQLWGQCQNYFSKIKEHDIHMGFVRTSMETTKQHALDLWPSSRGKPAPSGNSDLDELEERLARSNGMGPKPSATMPVEPANAARPEAVRPKSDRPVKRASIFDE